MEHLDYINKENSRVRAEYNRRENEIDLTKYAPWQPGEILMTSERKRLAAAMLRKIDRFPKAGDKCLEIGYGKLGWLADLISWGLHETDLHGIELDTNRAAQARAALPGADLRIGDASRMPWVNGYFDFVIVSTLFSSILDARVRAAIADEIGRVLSPGGIVIMYDIAVNNPRNKNLRRVSRSELNTMFSNFRSYRRSTTLAPPIARVVASRSWTMAVLLSSVPILRTHFLAVLVKTATVESIRESS